MLGFLKKGETKDSGEICTTEELVEHNTVPLAQRPSAQTVEAIASLGAHPTMHLEWDTLRKLYPNAVPLCTDSFMKKSADAYPAEWLIREIVQNFVDGNPDNSGTLNGVEFSRRTLPDGSNRYCVMGNWEFSDATGLLSLHSDKAEEVSAGGNGIGLKQVALRLMRDFSVRHFVISGEQWIVEYRMVNVEEANSALQERGIEAQLRHNWLIAIPHEGDIVGRNHCILETDDPVVIAAMQTFSEIGVSEENPYLKDLDYQHEKGSIKWLTKDNSTEPENGRLFVNGQVMRYGDVYAEERSSFWGGPVGVTIQLNNHSYSVSIDRSPVSKFWLKSHVSELIESMNQDDLLHQLHRSRNIWAGVALPQSGRWGNMSNEALIVLEQIVEKLSEEGVSGATSSDLFDERYVSYDELVSPEQVKELKEQGYVVCPWFFESIGMPPASSRVTPLEKASQMKPDTYKAEEAVSHLAESCGVPIGYTFLSGLNTPENFFSFVFKELGPFLGDISQEPNGSFHLSLKTDFNQAVMYSAFIPDKSDLAYEKLIREIILHGIHCEYFSNAFLSSGEKVFTFDVSYSLAMKSAYGFVRSTRTSGKKGLFLVISEENQIPFKKALSQSNEESQANELQSIDESNTSLDFEEIDGENDPPVGVGASDGLLQISSLKKAVHQLSHERSQHCEGGRNVQVYQAYKAKEDSRLISTGDPTSLEDVSIQDLVERHNVASVSPSVLDEEQSELREQIALASNLLSSHEIEEFEIVEPTSKERQQLHSLKHYVELCTGVSLKNDFFVFTGKGATGVNIKKQAIGIHRAVLQTSFTEALQTFVHECAHNLVSGHDADFISAEEAIMATIGMRLREVLHVLASGERTLTEEEQAIIALPHQWGS